MLKNRVISEKKQLTINIISNIVNFAVSMGISFFLTPFIVNTVGSAAYGFVSLANQFVGYIQIAVVALNSMASRFITIKVYEKDEKGAKTYFSSVFFANILMTLVLIVPITVCVMFIDRFLDIPSALVLDVKILWTLIFINFCVGLISNVFGIATYARNRLELSSLRNIESNIIKAVLLVVLYAFCRPSIIYIGIGAFVATVYTIILNIYYTKKLLPQMRISRQYFSGHAIKELVSSGVWNSLTQLSTTLLAGLDLLIANIFVGANAMGVLSVAKTIPNAINNLLGTIPGAFSPQFTIAYAEKKIDKLLSDINSAIKIMSVISCVPLVGLAVFGKAFFELWVPSEDAALLHILSILTVATTFVTAPIKPLYTIYTVTNKVKMESISVFIQGALSTVIVFILLVATKNSGIEHIALFIIAGTSTFFGIIRALTFTPMYAAHCLNLKKSTFYKTIIKEILSFVFAYVLESIIHYILPSNNWFTLILSGGVASVLGMVCNMFVILNKEERHMLVSNIFRLRK